MNNGRLVRSWQRRILALCRERLGRELEPREERMITSRGGFVALEMIEDTVRGLRGAELAEYLRSESTEE